MLLTLAGLNSLSIPVLTTGPHVLSATLSAPQLSQGASAPSQVVVTVVQNSTTIFTSTAGQEGFKVDLLGTVGDVLHVTASSSAVVDQGPNTIKAVIGFTFGV